MSAIESISFNHTELLRFITAGSVDDGKEHTDRTLAARLKVHFRRPVERHYAHLAQARDGRC